MKTTTESMISNNLGNHGAKPPGREMVLDSCHKLVIWQHC